VRWPSFGAFVSQVLYSYLKSLRRLNPSAAVLRLATDLDRRGFAELEPDLGFGSELWPLILAASVCALTLGFEGSSGVVIATTTRKICSPYVVTHTVTSDPSQRT